MTVENPLSCLNADEALHFTAKLFDTDRKAGESSNPFFICGAPSIPQNERKVNREEERRGGFIWFSNHLVCVREFHCLCLSFRGCLGNKNVFGS